MNFSETLIKMKHFLYNKMSLEMSSTKERPFCLGLSVLTVYDINPCFHKHLMCDTHSQYYERTICQSETWKNSYLYEGLVNMFLDF